MCDHDLQVSFLADSDVTVTASQAFHEGGRLHSCCFTTLHLCSRNIVRRFAVLADRRFRYCHLNLTISSHQFERAWCVQQPLFRCLDMAKACVGTGEDACRRRLCGRSVVVDRLPVRGPEVPLGVPGGHSLFGACCLQVAVNAALRETARKSLSTLHSRDVVFQNGGIFV